MGNGNHVELDWSVSGIRVGIRHRKDFGDLRPLVDSIKEHGLLQPLTVTQDGVLICGARRLAAIKQLGWKVVNVWVRVGLSDRLSALMAERDENISHKEFTKLELADLYEELKAEIAADAARRQQSAQFGPGGVHPRSSGVANLATPLGQTTGDSRRQAARMVGDGAGHVTLEKIGAIRQVAADEARPEQIRAQAVEALQHIEQGGSVDPLFQQVGSAARLNDLERIAADPDETMPARDAARSGAILLRKLEAIEEMTPADMEKASRAAVDRVKAARRDKTVSMQPAKPVKAKPVMRTLKWFTWTWNELADWTSQVDPAMVAAGLTADQWEQFQRTVAGTVAFRDTVAGLRKST